MENIHMVKNTITSKFKYKLGAMKKYEIRKNQHIIKISLT